MRGMGVHMYKCGDKCGFREAYMGDTVYMVHGAACNAFCGILACVCGFGAADFWQIWRVMRSLASDSESGQSPRLVYLSTLSKHTQAVNVVRFSPQGIDNGYR